MESVLVSRRWRRACGKWHSEWSGRRRPCFGPIEISRRAAITRKNSIRSVVCQRLTCRWCQCAARRRSSGRVPRRRVSISECDSGWILRDILDRNILVNKRRRVSEARRCAIQPVSFSFCSSCRRRVFNYEIEGIDEKARGEVPVKLSDSIKFDEHHR